MTTEIFFFLSTQSLLAQMTVCTTTLESGRSYASKILLLFFYEGGYKTAD